MCERVRQECTLLRPLLEGLNLTQFNHSVLSAFDGDLFDYIRGSFLSTLRNQFLFSVLAMIEPTFRLKYKELKNVSMY